MIKLEDISYTYKNGTKALKDINIEINSGEIIVVIGSNGSGKSTLGNVISRILKFSNGNIYINNENVNSIKSIDIRKKIGVVFQNPNNQIIFNRVYDDIAFTLNNLGFKDIDNTIKNSLKEIDMEDYMYSNPYELSIGQKQRVAIANILAVNSEYMVLDEVTSMLDASGKKDIYNIIKKLRKKNVGIIFITNIMEEILLADKLIILDKGRIIKVLKKDEIIDNVDILSDMGFELPFIIKVILKLKKKNINEYEEDKILSIIDGSLK